MDLPVLLVFVKNIFLTAEINKILKNKYYTIQIQSLEEAQERIEATSVDLILVEGASFFEEAKMLARSIRSAYGAFSIPIILVEPPLSSKKKIEAIEAGIAEYIYNTYDPDEWTLKMNLALKMGEWHEDASQKKFTKKSSKHFSTLPHKILEKLATREKTFTLLVQMNPIAPNQDSEYMALAKERLSEEIRKTIDNEALFLPWENTTCQIVLLNSSYRKAAHVAASLLQNLPHPIKFSVMKSGEIEGTRQEKFAHIVEKLLQAWREE